MKSNTELTDLSYFNLNNLDFSNSYLKNLHVECSSLWGVNFNNVTFENFFASLSDLRHSTFFEIDIRPGKFDLTLTTIEQGIFMPYKICEILLKNYLRYSGIVANYGSNYCIFGINFPGRNLYRIYETLKGILIFGLKNQLFTIDGIKKWFRIKSKKRKVEFFEMIDELKKYEVK